VPEACAARIDYNTRGRPEQCPGLLRDVCSTQRDHSATNAIGLRLRARLHDDGIEGCSLFRLAGEVQNDEVHSQTSGTPVMMRLQHLASERKMRLAGKLEEDDRQVSRDALRPEGARRAAAVADDIRG